MILIAGNDRQLYEQLAAYFENERRIPVFTATRVEAALDAARGAGPFSFVLVSTSLIGMDSGEFIDTLCSERLTDHVIGLAYSDDLKQRMRDRGCLDVVSRDRWTDSRDAICRILDGEVIDGT